MVGGIIKCPWIRELGAKQPSTLALRFAKCKIERPHANYLLSNFVKVTDGEILNSKYVQAYEV